MVFACCGCVSPVLPSAKDGCAAARAFVLFVTEALTLKALHLLCDRNWATERKHLSAMGALVSGCSLAKVKGTRFVRVEMLLKPQAVFVLVFFRCVTNHTFMP
jgi:hypothetical protein